MKRSCIFLYLFLLSVLCFAQRNAGITVIGRIPDAADGKLYQMQVGAFKLLHNAFNAADKLRNASLNPSYEEYMGLTRVLIKGVSAQDVPSYIEKIRRAGFSEVYIKIDLAGQLPVSTAALPSAALNEIAYRSIKVGETKSLADIVAGKNVTLWKSSTPSTVSVNPSGVITGLKIGNGYISINETEYISVAVVPAEDFYQLPDSQVAMLPPDSKTRGSSAGNLTEYRTEPTFRLAYRFTDLGVDILGRGSNYEWLWTTYYQGGWVYDLNGSKRDVVNGYKKDPNNGVELTVKPEFVYDKGTPYLQLRHILRNPGNIALSGQKFGAAADVMIHNNDDAPLTHTPYGAYMTDSETHPSLELMFVCESGGGINPVDTLWLGRWGGGTHLNQIYKDNRSEVRNVDSAICFSYQNIDLAPGPRQKNLLSDLHSPERKIEKSFFYIAANFAFQEAIRLNFAG
jgi:hypothetical protein